MALLPLFFCIESCRTTCIICRTYLFLNPLFVEVMRHFNPNKAVQATKNGIIISYADDKKSTMVHYDRTLIQQQQLHGKPRSTRPLQPQDIPFNDIQQFVYRKALYGLAVYTPEDVKTMEPREKFAIIRTQRKAQHLINVLKIDTINQTVRDLFGKFFWNSDQGKEFVDDKHTDYNEVCNMSFKDLGINKHMIAQKLIDSKVLPADFFQLVAA